MTGKHEELARSAAKRAIACGLAGAEATLDGGTWRVRWTGRVIWSMVYTGRLLGDPMEPVWFAEGVQCGLEEPSP